MSVHKANITGAVFRANFDMNAEVHVPHELERYIAEAVWQAGPTEENVHDLIAIAMTAARGVFADPALQWNQVMQRTDAQIAVSSAMVLKKVAMAQVKSTQEAGQSLR